VLTGGERGVSGVLGVNRLLVRLRPPARTGAVDRKERARSSLRLHVGTASVDAAMRRIRDAEGLALLTLGEPLATFAGDRGVLREPASGAVVAGVRVLDLDPPRGTSRRRLNPERLGALAAAVDAGDPVLVEGARLDLHGALPGHVAKAPRSTFRTLMLADDVRAALDQAAIAVVAAHHRDTPMSAGLPLPRARAALLRHLRSLVAVERQFADLAAAAVAQLLDDVVTAGRLERHGDALRDPARAADVDAELAAAMDRLVSALDVPAPPPLDAAAATAGCPPEGVRVLAAEGRITRLAPDLAWATPAYHRLAALALERARVSPPTPAAYRDATGTSRRFALAILEDLDRRGVLLRTPEGHVPGPRAPRASVG
jgi:selenocysteine-specific elongation factor